MVPCAITFEMEKQFQLVYTISKFKEVQNEFIGKVFVMSSLRRMNIFGQATTFVSTRSEEHFASHFGGVRAN